MGKYRPYILLGIAVVVALITSFLVYTYLQTRTKVEQVSVQTQPVAVAVVDISWGTTLNKEMIKKVDFLKGSTPPGSFSDSTALVGRVAIYPIKADEPIIESRLAPVTIKTGGVAAVITPKKRAVAIRVDKVIGVSGFIRPGNRVDVLVTIPFGKASTSIPKTILQNILVLTVGPELEKKAKEEKPSEMDVITLELTPEEAEKIALAAAEGKLTLALRNFNDTEDVLTKGSTVPNLLASYYGSVTETKAPSTPSVKEASRRGPASPRKSTPVAGMKTEGDKPKPFVVILIKGSSKAEVKFERSE